MGVLAAISRSCRMSAIYLLFVPLAGLAHTLEAPEVVQAGPDGSFEYEWVFEVGPGSAFIAGYGWWGLDNVPGGLHGDCFCIPEFCILKEGEVIVFPVEGDLLDPTQSGVVENWVGLCDEPDFRINTTILPPTSSAEDVSVTDSRATDFSIKPNPFSDRTVFSYSLSQAGPVELRIYDVMGRVVTTLSNGNKRPGEHVVTWHARDSEGVRVAQGVYLARLVADGMVRLRRIVVLH